MSGAACTAGALHECCQRGIPVLHLSGTGWFYGLTHGLPHKNVELRAEQFAAARDGERALAVARRLVAADSVVIGVLNNGEIGPEDFQEAPGGVLIKPPARKKLIAAYERRLAQEVKHPLFGYPCTYRRVFELEARLLGRYLLGEIDEYPGFEAR